ncbi:NAD(P)-dependent oxidoreductase [Oscillatoria amoena NRMC-F 0135]|nr:NAD(P)-dependent oxidoreductase [Oscillatoria laete-virens]MDL5047161.1 NAD(P)-dependent oxidoreductase [Oscillatoria amoena NRMC-F 0135]MDL5055506.1 NAD(P)-dependent oxidoreductase [Oscillatoria laete-virens NRMC-F 0139]
MSFKKILITGASGYQAAFIIKTLMGKYDLTLVDRVPPAAEFAGLRFVSADIADFEAIRQACQGQDAVIHLVALVRGRFGLSQELYADVMVKGTWNVAEACIQNGVKRLVNISSVVACGWPQDTGKPYHVGEAARMGGGDLFYCLSKHLGEEIGRVYHQGHGLEVIHLRPGMIAGDGANPDPRNPQDGSKYWFLHVHPEDVAQAVELSLRPQAPAYGAFHVLGDHPASLFDISETKEKLGYQPKHNWSGVM